MTYDIAVIGSGMSGLLASIYSGEAGMKTVLEHFGIEVTVPDQVCCDLPALGNGDLKKAQEFAKKNSREFAKFIDEGWDILYSCTSYGHTLIYGYPEILDTYEGKLISKNTWNLYGYLLLIKDEGQQILLGKLPLNPY